MPHLDPDRLVLIALGEQDPSASEESHLRTCAACGTDLDSTRTAVALSRESEHLRDLPAPPPDLWARIESSTRDVRLRSADRRFPVRGRRRLTLAAAAALLLVTTVVWFLHHDTERVVAAADLVARPSAPATAHGRATIVDTGHGLQLRLTLSGMPTPTGYYTVWLYDGGTVMIPIGSPGPAPLNVPAAADDLTTFTIVDVSLQRLGQQEHGTSMLQGRLS